MLNATIAALILTASPPLVTAEGVTLGEDGKKPWSAPLIGVQVDVGVPDGIGASLVVTPQRFIRVSLGGLSNGVGAGVRLGLTFVAFPSSLFRPLIGFDAGYVFGGEAAWLPELIENTAVRKAVSGMNVGFGNAQLGFELGSRNVAFTFRAGVAYVDVALRPQAISSDGATTITTKGLALRGSIPSARMGVILAFD